MLALGGTRVRFDFERGEIGWGSDRRRLPVLSSPCLIKSRALQHTFRIGEAYHVEPSLNRVTGPSGTIRLEPKVMLVLVCLAERAGQMITKDRLLHSAWADTAVGDDVLTRAISELRRLFEDDPKQPRVIETIPKSGYRLIAPVTLPPVHADDASALPAGEVKSAPATVLPRNRRGLGVFVAAGALMLVTAVVMWVVRPHEKGGTRPSGSCHSRSCPDTSCGRRSLRTAIRSHSGGPARTARTATSISR